MTVETSMLWFDRIFPPFMLLIMPLIYTIIPAKPSSETNAEKARKLQRLLWIVGVSSVVLYFLAYHAFGGGQWRQLWMLCFLQMPILNRLMQVKNPDYVTPHAGQTRTAALASRNQAGIVPTTAWSAVWILWGILSAIAAYGYFANAIPTRLGWMILMFVLGPALFLAFGPAMVKLVMFEPEPMDPNNSPALRMAYRKYRAARSWVFFALPTLIMIVFGVCAVAVAWLATSPQNEALIGLYGGILGGAAGMVGAITGVIFGIWRAKLNQTVRALSVEPEKLM